MFNNTIIWPVRRDKSETVRDRTLFLFSHWSRIRAFYRYQNRWPWVTLSDLERSNGRHYALFHTIRQLSEPTSNSLKLDSHYQQKNVDQGVLFLVYGDNARYLCGSWASWMCDKLWLGVSYHISVIYFAIFSYNLLWLHSGLDFLSARNANVKHFQFALCCQSLFIKHVLMPLLETIKTYFFSKFSVLCLSLTNFLSV